MTADAHQPSLPNRAWLKRAIKWTLALVVLGLVGWYVVDLYFKTDFEHDVVVRPLWSVLSGVMLLGMYGCILLSEWFLLDAFTKQKLPLRVMPAVTWIPLLGKFLPGKVASVAGATYVLKKAGVSAVVALSVFVVLDALPVLVGIILSGVLLLEPAVRAELSWAPWLFGIVLVAGTIALSPPVLRRVLTTGLKLMRREPLPHTPTLRDYGWPLVCALGQWAFNAAGITLLCVAFARPGEGPGVADLPRLVGVTALVMCASYVSSFVVMQGVGVREGLFLFLLGQIVPVPVAAAATVASRLLHVGLELLLAGVGFWSMRHLSIAAERYEEAAAEPSPEPSGGAT